MWRLVRSLLLGLEPERAHRWSLRAVQLAASSGVGRAALGARFEPRRPRPVHCMGLRFAHPVGLAAGYDKDGTAWRGLARLGFSHVEVGTVTPRPQPGNPRPRIFRLRADRALVNRLGFPSRGMDFVASRLAAQRPGEIVIGVNIGKNKETPLAAAAADYLAVMERLYGLCDYFAVNVSSPNTPGLRELQQGPYLEELLGSLRARRDELGRRTGERRPVAVKIAPDLDAAALSEILAAVRKTRIDGVIATNTTVARPALRSPGGDEGGGISGAPLTARAREVVAAVREQVGPDLAVIGVGGIMGPDDARDRLAAGADLVQLYTGLVYAGPSLPGRIADELGRGRAVPPRRDARAVEVSAPPAVLEQDCSTGPRPLPSSAP